MKNRLSTLVRIALFATTASYAQNKLTGVGYDADKQTALSGVEVHVRGTADGCVTNEDGTFTISTELVQGQVEIASMGYVTTTVSFVFSSESQINLGALY